MNELKIFENPEFGSVRTTMIDDEPWFVGKDVCCAFGDTNHKRSLARLDDEDKGVHRMDTPGGTQQMTIINESGLYSLLLYMQPKKAKGVTQSDPPFEERVLKLKRFKRWVTSEVLPAIRKTGKYVVPQCRQRDLTTDDYLKAAQIVAQCKNERLPYVMGFLNKAGFDVAEIQNQTVITQNYNIISDSAVGFLQSCEDFQIEGTPTNVAYAKYQDYCTEHDLGLLNKGEFSKQVKRCLGLSIIDKKIQGKKYRIFVKE